MALHKLLQLSQMSMPILTMMHNVFQLLLYEGSSVSVTRCGIKADCFKSSGLCAMELSIVFRDNNYTQKPCELEGSADATLTDYLVNCSECSQRAGWPHHGPSDTTTRLRLFGCTASEAN